MDKVKKKKRQGSNRHRVATQPDKTWNSPAVIVASGPSLGFDDYADVELIRQANIKTIAVNSSFKIAPFCSALYGGDGIWWKYNHKEATELDAEKWACSKTPCILYGVKYRPRQTKPGYNSGANAIELAVNVYQCNPVILLGFDCSVKHGVHHHGRHKFTSNPTKDRALRWVPQFESLQDKIKCAEVINCSRYTELNVFKKAGLKDTLCAHGLI